MPLGTGQDEVVLGNGRDSPSSSTAMSGAGCLNRSRICDKRRSMIYGDSSAKESLEGEEEERDGGVGGVENDSGNGDGSGVGKVESARACVSFCRSGDVLGINELS